MGHLYEQVQDLLLADIRSGKWLPNERIPPLIDLSEIYEFSVGTVYLGVRKLTEAGLLRSNGNRGIFVEAKALERPDSGEEEYVDLPGEEWLPVVGFPYYEVSNLGGVRSTGKTITDKAGRERYFPPKILKSTINSRGYVQVGLRLGRRNVTRNIHNLIMEAFVGLRPEGMYICHYNGIKTDARLDNLRYDTPKENCQDRFRHEPHLLIPRQHCSRGHEMRAPNLPPYLHEGARPDCRACRLALTYAATRRRVHGESHDVAALADDYYRRIMDGSYTSVGRRDAHRRRKGRSSESNVSQAEGGSGTGA